MEWTLTTATKLDLTRAANQRSTIGQTTKGKPITDEEDTRPLFIDVLEEAMKMKEINHIFMRLPFIEGRG